MRIWAKLINFWKNVAHKIDREEIEILSKHTCKKGNECEIKISHEETSRLRML